MSPKGHITHARRHDLGHITLVQYAPVLVCEFFTSVQFNSIFFINFNSPSSLQSDGAHKLILKSSASLRRFFQRLSRKKGLGQN